MKNTKPRACTHDDLIVFSEIHEGKVYCGVCEKYFNLEEWSPDKPKLTSKAKRFPECHVIISVKVKPTKDNGTRKRRVHKKTLNEMQKNIMFMLQEAVEDRFPREVVKDIYFQLEVN